MALGKQLITLAVALCFCTEATATETNITFSDNYVKSLCVEHWDSDGDGELSTEEAASVTTLGTVFRENSDIVSFDELRYFTGLTSINEYAFYKSRIQKLIFPESVTEIGEYAFSESGISGELIIPGTVKEIKNYAFYSCRRLTSVVLEEGVETVGWHSFSGPIGTLVLPASLVFMKSMAIDPYVNADPSSGIFMPEGHLWVFVRGETPAAIDDFAFYLLSESGHLVVPVGALEAYRTDSRWAHFTHYSTVGDVNVDGTLDDSDLSAIEEFISSGESEFNPLLSDVNFDGVTDEKDVEYLKNYIEKLASLIIFADSSVKSLCVEHWDSDGDGELSTEEAASVTTLGTVFRENSDIVSFDELRYFTGLTSINEYAFYKSRIQKLIFPESVTEIGEYAFSESGISGELIIPGTVKEIKNYAFYSCRRLTSVVLEEGVETVGWHSFSGPIGTLVLPASLVFMKSMAIDPYVNADPSSGIFMPEGHLWVFVRGETPAAIDDFAFYLLSESGHLVVPVGALDAYRADSRWAHFTHYLTVGDVNGDGTLDDSDLSAIEEFISSGESEFNPLLSDVNFDGVTDGKDVEYLKYYIESTSSVTPISLTPDDTRVYTIEGRRLSDKVNISSLPPGVYIYRGRKIIVK